MYHKTLRERLATTSTIIIDVLKGCIKMTIIHIFCATTL